MRKRLATLVLSVAAIPAFGQDAATQKQYEQICVANPSPPAWCKPKQDIPNKPLTEAQKALLNKPAPTLEAPAVQAPPPVVQPAIQPAPAWTSTPSQSAPDVSPVAQPSQPDVAAQRQQDYEQARRQLALNLPAIHSRNS